VNARFLEKLDTIPTDRFGSNSGIQCQIQQVASM
jgi:hypothetical protein